MPENECGMFMDLKSQMAAGQKEGVKEFTLQDVARKVNNVNLDEEIVVVEDWCPGMSDMPVPARINALLIILCTHGKGRIGIDLKEYAVKRDTLLVIHPKNYIYLTDYDEDARANIVACSGRVVEDVLPKLTDLLPLLIHHRTEPVTDLSEEEAANLNTFYKFLRAKLTGPRTPFLQRKVLCMLQAALFEMMDIHHAKSGQSMFHRSRKEEIMAKFIIAVSDDFREHREVSYYAERLCITPKHLSAIAKGTSGRTAGEWIESYVTMEAKVLLKSTDLTIQEIADRLNFANQSFFGKYFKHQTGLSPTAYRREFS